MWCKLIWKLGFLNFSLTTSKLFVLLLLSFRKRLKQILQELRHVEDTYERYKKLLEPIYNFLPYVGFRPRVPGSFRVPGATQQKRGEGSSSGTIAGASRSTSIPPLPHKSGYVPATHTYHSGASRSGSRQPTQTFPMPLSQQCFLDLLHWVHKNV